MNGYSDIHLLTSKQTAGYVNMDGTLRLILCHVDYRICQTESKI